MEEIAKYFDGEAIDVADIANAEVKARGLAGHVELTEKGGKGSTREVEDA